MTDATAIPMSAAQRENIYRRNFVYFLTDGILFTVAMNVIGSTTVIPDFVRQLTSSEILIGLSGSLFEVGWTLPQLFIARYIVGYARKKWWFVGPSIPVRFVMLIFALLVVALGRERPEATLALFFICYGITAVGDGIVGVPWADLNGTSLDSRWRARAFGLMSASAGVIMLLASPLIGRVLGSDGPGFPNNYAILFGVSGALFALSLVPILFIHELPGGKAVEKLPSLSEFLPDLWQVLRTDLAFRAIVITRMLTTLFAMAGPFYIGFATGRLNLSSDVAVPNLLAMQTVGAVSGALLYAWFGARSNLTYIRLAVAGAALLPVSALLAARVGPWPLYAGFLISGLTVSNLFIGYLNYVITLATPDRRPIYAGLFNTIAAVSSLLAPFIAGTIVSYLGYQTLFTVALVMALLALYVSLRHLKRPEQEPGLEMAAAD